MFQQIRGHNWVRVLGPVLEDLKWFFDRRLNQYTCQGRSFLKVDGPWIYTNPHTESACKLYQAIVQSMHFIPKPCLACWKIVVVPHTLYELFQVYEWQKEFTKGHIGKDRFCKCGIETRWWTPRDYGAYFYTDSKEQGLERWKQVREAVDKINPEIRVILKRACTEFEIDLGPSDEWERPAWGDELEDEIFSYLDLRSVKHQGPQPPPVIRNVLEGWVKHAWQRGDPTVIGFNDNKPLVPPVVTYHPKTD